MKLERAKFDLKGKTPTLTRISEITAEQKHPSPWTSKPPSNPAETGSVLETSPPGAVTWKNVFTTEAHGKSNSVSQVCGATDAKLTHRWKGSFIPRQSWHGIFRNSEVQRISEMLNVFSR